MVTLSPDVKLMTPAQAREALRFLEEHQADVGTVVVHRESGIPRRPAVAAALCKAIGGDDGRFWRDYRPNQCPGRLSPQEDQRVSVHRCH